MSLEEYLCECLRALTLDDPPDEVADELLGLMQRCGGHSDGRRIRREEAFEGRVQ